MEKRKWLRNSYDCGCEIYADSSGGCFIQYCPKHKAAPDLYEALRGFIVVLKEFNDMLLTRKGNSDIVAKLDYLLDKYGAIAEQAIDKAEGKDVNTNQ